MNLDAGPAATPSNPLVRWTTLIDRNHGTWRGWVRGVLGQLELLSGRLDRFTRIEPARVRRLVFVCLGNINRSAFAAAVARRLDVPCASIGLSTSTGAPAFEQAVAQARRMGYSLADHRATDLADYAWREGDLLLAMEVRHVHRLRAHGIPADAIALLGCWSTPRRVHLHDPHTLSDAYYATCFTLIESAVRGLCVPAHRPTPVAAPPDATRAQTT